MNKRPNASSFSAGQVIRLRNRAEPAPPWTVAELPRGRRLAADFKPTKVVYALLLPNGRQLTPDTLFPVSQATLAHAARILGTYGIDVEVVGIPAA